MSTLSIDYSRIHLLSDPKVSVGRERTEAEAGLIMSGWRMIPLEDLGQLLSRKRDRTRQRYTRLKQHLNHLSHFYGSTSVWSTNLVLSSHRPSACSVNNTDVVSRKRTSYYPIDHLWLSTLNTKISSWKTHCWFLCSPWLIGRNAGLASSVCLTN